MLDAAPVVLQIQQSMTAIGLVAGAVLVLLALSRVWKLVRWALS